MSSGRVLVTGATGFVGSALVPRLLEHSWQVRLALRGPAADGFNNVEAIVAGEVGPDTEWDESLNGVDTVVHLAARVHVLRERSSDPLAAFRSVNVAGTERLATAAARNGIRRFVYLSSVKVSGEQTFGKPFTEADAPAPSDPYGESKREAEDALRNLAAATALEIVILRPPLVYGPGVKANFLSLMKAVDHGWPLPLGAVQNRRSFVYLGNLVSAIIACLEHPAAAGRTYLVADGPPVATPELIRRLARALDRPARLVPVPAALMRFAGRLLGRGDAVDRLLGSLAVDDSLIRRELGWVPPYTMDEGLRATADWFRSQCGR